MNKKPLQIISLGAGVQSTALMIMAERGEITPKPDFAIFQTHKQNCQKPMNTLRN